MDPLAMPLQARMQGHATMLPWQQELLRRCAELPMKPAAKQPPQPVASPHAFYCSVGAHCFVARAQSGKLGG